MKYYATVDDHTYEISVESGRVLVDGEEMSSDMRALGGAGLYSLLLDHVSHDVIVETTPENRSTYSVLVAGQRYVVRVQDERSRRLSLADRGLKAPTGELVLRAPIPGLVVRVAVTPGQDVAQGDTVLILEAMKMENELRAPRAGVVHEVRVAPGVQVASGQTLVLIR